VSETLDRIQSHRGVQEVLIVSSSGIPIRPSPNMETEQSFKYAASITQLAAKAKSVVRDLDPQNDLTFLRIRSKRHEIMVAPDKDFLLIVIQDPTISNKSK
jgi:dynein light chain roadblock-type